VPAGFSWMNDARTKSLQGPFTDALAWLHRATGIDLFRKERASVSVSLNVQNLADRLFLYNFESVFSGTHIGPPRLWSGRLTFRFR